MPIVLGVPTAMCFPAYGWVYEHLVSPLPF